MIRYLVFGTGAVGTLLGGLLARAGHTVHFIGRPGTVEAIRARGIRISGLWGDHEVPPQPAFEAVRDLLEAEARYDQILICTKAFDTEPAVEACRPVVQDATLVISFQNGYGNVQTIAEAVGRHRTLGARVITGVEVTDPGRVHVTVHADAVRIGHYWNEYPLRQIESIALAFQEAWIPAEATDQLEKYIWAKILYNAALNPLGALLGVTYGDLAKNAATRETMDRIIDEAFAATQAHGIGQFWNTPDEYRKAFYDQMVPTTASHFPSMLRDIERRSRTEIDSLNGAVSRLGALKNIPTPVNDTVISLIRFRETFGTL